MTLTDLLGTKIDQCQISSYGEPETVVKSIQAGLQHLMGTEHQSRGKILGMGIAMSGYVDHDTGVCMYSADLDWHDIPIADFVTQSIGIPVRIDNDANAIAVAEKFSGEARELRNFSIVMLGKSVGCAHYINSELYRGNAGGAGEIGHMTVAPEGLPCRCGKRGCLDTVAGSKAIISAALAVQLPVKNVRDIESLAVKGNPHAIAILHNAGKALGMAVANVIQVNNPEVVFFADLAGFERGLFSTTTRQTIENNILPRFLSSTRLLFHHVEPGFVARGAASIAAREFLLEQATRSDF
jgi:predicted NBD/HSP70 family sugar kinase